MEHYIRTSVVRSLQDLLQNSLLNSASASEQLGQHTVEFEETSSKPRIDPISFFPIELLQTIFSYLPVTMLPNCRLVSKAWQDTSDLTFDHTFLPGLGTPRDFLRCLHDRIDILKDKQVRLILAREIAKYPRLQRLLLDIVMASKENENLGLAPAVAITLLNVIILHDATNLSFSGMDLRGVRIANAILDGVVFDSTNLERADLRSVSFCRAWLRNAKPKGSQLAKAQFNDSPALQLKKEAHFKLSQEVYSPDGKYRAGVDEKYGVLRLSEAKTDKYLHAFHACINAIGINFNKDGRLLAFSDHRTAAIVWNIQTRECVATLKTISSGESNHIAEITFSNDGRFIATCTGHGVMEVWDLESDNQMPIFCDLNGSMNRIMAFSNDGTFLVKGSNQGPIRVWDVRNSKHRCILSGHTKLISHLAFSNNGKFLVSTSQDKTVRVWNMHSGECLHVLSRNIPDYCDGEFSTTTFSDDDKFLVNRGDKYVQVWDAQSGKCRLSAFSGHEIYRKSIAFSPNGRFFAIGCYDNIAQIWDLKSGQCVCTLGKHTAAVVKVQFKDDRHLTCYADGIWHWQIDEQTGTSQLLSTTNPILNCEGLNVEGAIGVSQNNLKLLRRFGARVILQQSRNKDETRLEHQTNKNQCLFM